MKYSVDIDRKCVRDFHDGKKYGDWESEYDNSFRSIRPITEDDHGDIESVLELKDGDKCWVVWIEYSSGDSFGHGTRCDVDSFGVFTSEEAADQLKSAIESFERGRGDYRSTVKLTTCDGQEFDIYPSWEGYFERLDEVHVERAIMGEVPKRTRW